MRVERLKEGIPWQEQDFGGRRLQKKTVCLSRYGGFGDMIQMSSLLPGLKEQGYSITVNTTPQGYDIIKHDPFIDAVFLQEHGQVPNHELGFFWDKLAKCFDKFVMLSESVEGALLALPERRAAGWHPDFRRMIMGTVDYLEATHAIAEVPLPIRPCFHPSKSEIKKAEKRRARMGRKNFVVLWALSGSSVHKTYPWMDQIIARAMVSCDRVKFVLVGDPLCKVLEQGWEKEPRVECKSGKWSIRDTLAFAQFADLVIGPETGVLNSVAVFHMPKLLMLSHSSPANIGSNWTNTIQLTPENTPCYPCHILHRGFDLCHRHEETGAAECAANIPPDTVWNAMQEIFDGNNVPTALPKVS